MQVRETDLSVLISTLEEEFNIYKEVGGESVPVHSQDGFNGLQKNGREGKRRSHAVGARSLSYEASSSRTNTQKSSSFISGFLLIDLLASRDG